MAKAKFGLNDILNAKSRAAAAGRVEDYEEIYLSPYEVRAAPENTHQSLENIEELADSFLHVGQLSFSIKNGKPLYFYHTFPSSNTSTESTAT